MNKSQPRGFEELYFLSVFSFLPMAVLILVPLSLSVKTFSSIALAAIYVDCDFSIYCYLVYQEQGPKIFTPATILGSRREEILRQVSEPTLVGTWGGFQEIGVCRIKYVGIEGTSAPGSCHSSCVTYSACPSTTETKESLHWSLCLVIPASYGSAFSLFLLPRIVHSSLAYLLCTQRHALLSSWMSIPRSEQSLMSWKSAKLPESDLYR